MTKQTSSADTHMNLGHTRIDRLILDQLRKRKLGCLYEDRRDAEIMRNRTVTRPPTNRRHGFGAV